MNVTLTPIGGANRSTQLAALSKWAIRSGVGCWTVTISWRARRLKGTAADQEQLLTAFSPPYDGPGRAVRCALAFFCKRD
jgi:hypothetical protein